MTIARLAHRRALRRSGLGHSSVLPGARLDGADGLVQLARRQHPAVARQVRDHLALELLAEVHRAATVGEVVVKDGEGKPRRSGTAVTPLKPGDSRTRRPFRTERTSARDRILILAPDHHLA